MAAPKEKEKRYYDIHELRRAHDAFMSADCFSILKDGKWTDTPLVNGVKQPRTVDGTASRFQKLEKVMDFPEFLSQHWKG